MMMRGSIRIGLLVGAGMAIGVSLQAQGRPGGMTPEVVVENMREINSPAIDFAPAYYGSGLVFVSSRSKGGYVNPVTGQTYYNLYYAPFGANGRPVRPREFSLEISSALHEGPVAFDQEQNTIYFTRSNQEQGVPKPDQTGRVRLKIYKAVRGVYDWEKIEELPFNSDEYSCIHPSLSPDGSKLFFASNMPGGYGGMDIYMVLKQGQGWSEPINLGPEINTPKQETFPFYHESGTLFFSSNGHKGQGGVDIYSIDLSGSRWGELTNLGAPVNSPADDFGFILDRDGKKGYFSSNRKGGLGRDDIFAFTAPQGLPGLRMEETFALRVNVQDLAGNYPLAATSVFLFERSPDGSIADDLAYTVELAPDSTGLALRLNRKSAKELGSPSALTDRQGNALIMMSPLNDYVILIAKEGYKTVEIPFIPDKVDPGAPLNVRMERSTCITVSGAVVSNTSNQPITNAVVRILNSCDGKEQVLISGGKGEYESCLELGCNFTLMGEKEGYQPYRTQLSLENVRGSRSFTVNLRLGGSGESLSKAALEEGVIITLDNIYYDFNQAVIRKGQARDLEALAALMRQYPGMQIELGAHTDSRGSAEYNLELSKQRAEAAKLFLVSKGIESSRIQTKGYGETYPRNGCVDGVDCTEIEHQFNRRTEVKVLRMDSSAGKLPAEK